MKNNIILIGPPGCGKSTCGVLAAKIACMRFVDTDLIIQQNEGKILQQIIDENGNDYFEKCEEKWVCSVNEQNCIIATGGSVVYSEKSMSHLKSIGKIVYLKISYDDMKKRITNLDTRGVLMKNGNTLRDMYNERVALYEKYADVTIECTERSTIEQTARKIAGVLQ